jgi:glycosyltransferase involved in cell wall biosynthesis
MKICYFGDYDPNYARTRILIKGLQQNGVEVLECNAFKTSTFKKLRALYAMHKQIGTYDGMIVGQGSFRLMPVFARCITRKPIIWEPLFSLHDAWVYDRKLASPYSPKALLYWLIDWCGSTFTDRTLLDTKGNADYFINTFHLRPEKLLVAFIGADPDVFFPKPRTTPLGAFEIEFHGKYIPVQGTDVLVRAAKLLSDDPSIHFTMIGSGQEAKRTQALAADLGVSNITFHGFLPQSQITGFIANADVCIGLVGDVPRVGRAIPNKLYEAAAMGKVSINVEGISIGEVFTPGVDVITVKQGNAEDVAQKIRELKNDPMRAKQMGDEALRTFSAKVTPAIIGKKLRDDISTIVSAS